MRGKKVRCKACGEIFSAPLSRAAADDDEDDSRGREERLQDRPRSAPPPPRRRRDEEEDEPRRPRRRDVAARRPQGQPVALIVGLAVAGLLLVGVGVGCAVWFLASGPTPADPAVAGVAADAAAVAQPGVGGAPVAAAAPAGQPLRYRWQGGPHVYAVRVEVERDDVTEISEGNCVIHAQKAGAPGRPAAPEERKGSGTGFVVNPNGYLVTCAHVVADAVKVEAALGGRAYPATVLAVDHDHDLAVVKINAQDLPSLLLANSDSAEVGMEVRAFGFPLSTLLGENLKVTRGTLSGVNQRGGRKVFQIDASVNPGNSGGPLVTEAGAVLGVTSAKLSGEGVSNVGFATPSNEVQRLLRGKGVPFTAGNGVAKLDGPALVRGVSPAVALITVTLGQSAGAESYKLSCNGHLVKREQPKAGVVVMPGPPRFPRFPGFTQPSQIQMDSTGRVQQASGGTQLPMLLGEMGVFLIDPLPSDIRPSWEVTGTCTIGESSGGPRVPFGPRFMPRGPRGPFGPPGFPGFPNQQQTTTREATERTSYTRGPVAGDTVTINKRYELRANAAGASPGLNMTGDGQITFDMKEGLPRAVSFKATLTVTSANTTRRIPISVSYKLLQGAERERILHPPPPPKVEPKPFTDADLTRALADLQGADKGRRSAALNRLIRAKPTPARRDEVARALNTVLADTDQFTRMPCLKAIAIWGTKENVPALLPLVGDNNVFVRRDAIAALGKLQDERAAEPIAKRLVDLGDRGTVSKALQEIGSKAEKAVLPYLEHSDLWVRLEACKILKVIGTRESKAALDKASGDSNGLVAREAKSAAQAVAARP
jgi:S1-C subfamily serine protease